MTTVPSIDFLAPAGRYSRYSELLAIRAAKTISAFEPQIFPKFQADSTDRFTHLIFGLAVLIAIVIPILNLG